jgi:hypothetical protein
MVLENLLFKSFFFLEALFFLLSPPELAKPSVSSPLSFDERLP